jgi:NADP-dependent 3-hydroxy acid dehydrogenase YdfG
VTEDCAASDTPATDETDEPQKPNLKLVDINLTAVLYTTKLAMHYFVRQPEVPGRDRCLILKGSLGSYLDTPGNIVYNVTKWGVRSLMRNLRQSAWEHHMRVNLIAPW